MKKVDHKKELKHLYSSSSKKIVVVDVPTMNYLMIDGKGDPNTSTDFNEAVEALYAVAYSIKFAIKKGKQQIDYKVMPLEGLWWAEDMNTFSAARKNEWIWTMMIMQPEFVTKKIVSEMIETVRKKKDPKALEKIRFESFTEGKAAQILYIGPYANETETITNIHESILQSGKKLNAKHHEIYLNDPRKSAPEKLKTIIRQPMK
jgi:hypothetical protein